MNPRILKKLTKRADLYVSRLNTGCTRFVTDADTRDIGSAVTVDKKHLERWHGTPNRFGYFTALKGTVGYGSMVGYYEPEWEDNDAYSILKESVQSHFVDWGQWDMESHPLPSKRIKTPRDVFRYASEVVQEQPNQSGSAS